MLAKIVEILGVPSSKAVNGKLSIPGDATLAQAIESLAKQDILTYDISTAAGFTADQKTALIEWQNTQINEVRQDEYVQAGITVEEYLNCVFDGSPTMEELTAKRNAIKIKYPKPSKVKA